MKLVFRRMEQKDLGQIAKLEAEIFNDAWPEESFAAELGNEQVSYPIVMLKEERILGYAVVWQIGDEIQINNIAVVPEARNKGCGSALLAHIFKKYSTFSSAWLEVRASNQAAIRLYEKFNFNTRFVRRAYYSDGEDALVMEKIR